jgi:predicted KAP-like P-loop ATPase
VIFNDAPIQSPHEDKYGIDPFARSLARSIESVTSPEGIVIALYGPWGSGKSSAVNLVLHHLKPAEEAGKLTIVRFNPWWFSGAESLTLAYFEALQAAFAETKPDTIKSAIKLLGRRLSRRGPLLGAVVDMLTAGFGGRAVEATAEWVGDVLGDEQPIEAAYSTLVNELHKQSSRFLIVIDDIDRLSPDEALLVFRLVKSVGRLPNVIYLLAFDRSLAERIINERFPSEGPNYLEKIVQAGFDLPPPDVDELRQVVLAAAEAIGCAPKGSEEKATVRFMNLFYDVVAPYLSTPRDAIRMTNILNVTWPAVKEEADPADFLSVQALRLFEPAVFGAIREHPTLLCGLVESHERQSREDNAAKYDELLLRSIPEWRKEGLRCGLRRNGSP